MRRDGVAICECKDESCLYPLEIMKDMMKHGYKFYQNGKILVEMVQLFENVSGNHGRRGDFLIACQNGHRNRR